MAAVSEREESPVPAYDPMRQFSELAGDVRDSYPVLADLPEATPVLQVSLEEQTNQLQNDAKAPKLPPLFTVFSHEYVEQVLTDNLRFSSTVYESSMGQVMGATILQMDAPEHQRHRALVAKAFRARVLEQWSDTVIGATVNELINAFAVDGPADLIEQLTIPFPSRRLSPILAR